MRSSPEKQQQPTIKLSPLPSSFIELPNMQPLPPLSFDVFAGQPLTKDDIAPSYTVHKLGPANKATIQINHQNHREQLSKLRKELQIIYEDYLREKEEHEYWKKLYQQGEIMYNKLQQQNQKLLKEIQASTKKKVITRNSGAHKDIPVIKITVPTTRSSENQPNQSVYRQLRAASEQINSMKKMLESEKQKAEYLNNVANKNIQQLNAEKKDLMAQNQKIRDENSAMRQQISRSRNSYQKNASFQGYQSYHREAQNKDELVEELKRIKRIHQSCDILIKSKETQVLQLKNRVAQLENFQPKQSIYKSGSQFYEYSQSDKNKYQASFAKSQYSPQMNVLNRHLELSTKEMENMEKFIRQMVAKFINKTTAMKSEIDRLNKSNQSQKFELARVYELLNEKKHLLQVYEQDLSAAKRLKTYEYQKSPHSEKSGQYFKSILKDRREMGHEEFLNI